MRGGESGRRGWLGRKDKVKKIEDNARSCCLKLFGFRNYESEAGGMDTGLCYKNFHRSISLREHKTKKQKNKRPSTRPPLSPSFYPPTHKQITAPRIPWLREEDEDWNRCEDIVHRNIQSSLAEHK